MPLFRRSDGELVSGLSDVRYIMPYVMRGRNESAIYHTTYWKSANARAWLRAYNRARGENERATLFHLLIFSCAKALNERTGLNRFVAGGRIYQRKDVWISFAAKRRMVDDAPLVTVKLKFPANEPFEECVKRIVEAVNEGRSDRKRRIERELHILTRLPGVLLRVVLAAGRWLDRLNLLPEALIEPDPMYTSLFLANLGSVAIGNAYHHLYEYGTCTLFGVMGNVKKEVSVDRGGKLEVQEVLQLFWTFDERVNDAFYCAESLGLAQRVMENPAEYISRLDSSAEATVESSKSTTA